MIKRLLNTAFVILFLVSLLPCVSKASGGMFVVSDVVGLVGEEIVVSISLNNNPGIASFNLRLDFDKSKLEPIDIMPGTVIAKGGITSNMQIPGVDLTTLDFITAFWCNILDVKSDGVLYVVKFKIKDSGNTHLTLSYNEGDVSNQRLNDVNPTIENGVIMARFYTQPIPTISMNTTSPDNANQFDVIVSIGNNPGISAFALRLNFDKTKLEPVSIAKGTALAVGSITSNLYAQNVDLSELDFVTAVWHDVFDVDVDGVIFTVTFRVKSEQVAWAKLSISYKKDDISNQANENIVFFVTPILIKFVDSPDYSIVIDGSNLKKENNIISGSVDVVISNITPDTPDATVALAIYTEHNRLVDIKFIAPIPLVLGDNPLRFTNIEIRNANDNVYHAKVMCWNTEKWMDALSVAGNIVVVRE